MAISQNETRLTLTADEDHSSSRQVRDEVVMEFTPESDGTRNYPVSLYVNYKAAGNNYLNRDEIRAIRDFCNLILKE
mgnify:CR=1 FL=1